MAGCSAPFPWNERSHGNNQCGCSGVIKSNASKLTLNNYILQVTEIHIVN